jgi:hypothetical protein
MAITQSQGIIALVEYEDGKQGGAK